MEKMLRIEKDVGGQWYVQWYQTDEGGGFGPGTHVRYFKTRQGALQFSKRAELIADQMKPGYELGDDISPYEAYR